MKEIFTTFEVAKMCNVDITTVINWVNTGKLTAYKTPGGHRRIRRNDFVDFLKKFDLPVPRGLAKAVPIILIVEDEPQIRALMKKIIQTKYSDAEIHETDDGFAAGKLLAETSPNLVILDLKLKGIDGFQVCRLIRDDRRLKHTKILAVTGYHSQAVKQQILKMGANGYLQKPFTPAEMIDQVKKYIE
jgi:excisionase family DNA binding protein